MKGKVKSKLSYTQCTNKSACLEMLKPMNSKFFSVTIHDKRCFLKFINLYSSNIKTKTCSIDKRKISFKPM